MYMEEYLLNLSKEVTERELQFFSNKSEHENWRKIKTDKFVKMLGIEGFLSQARTNLNIVFTGEIYNEAYIIDKLYFESLPNLYVTANLYTPNLEQRKYPAILFLCGHAKTQKHRYQEHARSLCRAGFVVLIIDTIQLGEVKGIHAGTYKHGFFHWISKGYSPAAVETWNAIRAIDLLEELSQVDSNKIGVTGNSGGGAITWWVSCVDRRIKASATSCGTGTIHSHINHKTINGHCDCMFPNNPYGWSLIEMYSLVAPNPLLILSPENDKHFEFESVSYVYKRLKELYENLKADRKISFFSFPGPHGYSPESRKTITQFFLNYLKDEQKSIEAIHDFDGHKESLENLSVYNEKLPANDASTSVQDWFIPEPETPTITDVKEFYDVKSNMKQILSEESFTYINKLAKVNGSQKVNIEQNSLANEHYHIKRFSYITEKDYRLTGVIQGKTEAFERGEYLAVNLRNLEMKKEDISLIDHLGDKWMKTCLNIRGTGTTSWIKTMDWYVRRALALCGTTLASLRVWDTLQGINALRRTFKNPKNIVIAGKGEMAVVAILAAFLDGNISGVILEEPPSSFNSYAYNIEDNVPIEVNNVSRFVDLSTITALLWPATIVFYHKKPRTFKYTEKVFKHLGFPGGIWNIKDISQLANISFNCKYE